MFNSIKNKFLKLIVSICLALPLIYIITDKLQKYTGKIEVLKNFTTDERVIDIDHNGFTEEISLNNIEKDHFYGEVWDSKSLLGVISEKANLVKNTLKIQDLDKDSVLDYCYLSTYKDTLYLKSSELKLLQNKVVVKEKPAVVICPLVIQENKPEVFRSQLIDIDGDTFDDYVFTLCHGAKHRTLYYYNFRRKKLYCAKNEFMFLTDFHKVTVNSKNIVLYTSYANGNICDESISIVVSKLKMDSVNTTYFSDCNAYAGYLNQNLLPVGKPKFKKGFTGMIRAIPVLVENELFYYTLETYLNEPDSQQIVKLLDKNLNTVLSSKITLPFKNELYNKFNREIFQKITIDGKDKIILCGRNDSVYELTTQLKLNFLFNDPNIKEGAKVKQIDLSNDGELETIFFSGNITIFSNGLKDKLSLESPATIKYNTAFDESGSLETKKGFYLKSDEGKLVFLTYALNPVHKFKFLFMILSILIVYSFLTLIIKIQTKKLEKEKLNLEVVIKERTQEISHQNIELGLRNGVIEEKQKEILDSIHYAKRIQNALLANQDLISAYIPDSFILFKPKDIVSGDFYWATEHNQKFYLAICDSTGHGVPGAFMSLLNMGFLSEAIKEKNIENTGEIFDYVRMRLVNSISKDGQSDGMDGIIICYDKKNATLEYSAANNAPILIRNNELIELEKDRMPVGKGERENNFKKFSLSLKPGDLLYLYTDGYADQFGGPKGKKFKYKTLNDLLISLSNMPLNNQHEQLSEKFEAWKGNLEQVDDVCVVGIRL